MFGVFFNLKSDFSNLTIFVYHPWNSYSEYEKMASHMVLLSSGKALFNFEMEPFSIFCFI